MRTKLLVAIIFAFVSVISFADDAYRVEILDADYNEVALVELNKLDSISVLQEIKRSGRIMDFAFSVSPSRRYLFFACGSIENETAEIFGHSVRVIDEKLQFIYDFDNDLILGLEFTQCNSWFVSSQWFESDSLLVLDTGTSMGRGLVIYNYSHDIELYYGTAIARSFRGNESDIVLFDESREFLVFNSFSCKDPGVPREAYWSIATLVDLETYEVLVFQPTREDEMTEIVGFDGTDKLLYEKYEFNSAGEKIYSDSADRRIEYQL